MTARSIRRAAERKAKKQARKAERLAAAASPSNAEPAQHTVKLSPVNIPSESQQPAPDCLRQFTSISPVQLAANRANAQLSTGPRTAAGLARSSQNAVKSALTGRTVLLPTDDVNEYAAFLAAFQAELAPVGQVERELVQSIVDTHWRLRRIQALEFALYAHGHEQFADAFNDCPEESRYNRIVLQTHLTYEKQFRNLQIQEARLDRRRGKDMAELRRLQAERKANSGADEEDFSDLDALLAPAAVGMQVTHSNPLPENGFEFSNDVLSNSSDFRTALENQLLGRNAA